MNNVAVVAVACVTVGATMIFYMVVIDVACVAFGGYRNVVVVVVAYVAVENDISVIYKMQTEPTHTHTMQWFSV